MSEILKINDLWGGYKDGVDILRGISMEVQQGEAVGIIGLNGSGKSTLGKSIMNMIPFRSGEILFNSEDITTLSTSELSHRGISIMQQGGKVFQNLSIWENLQLSSKTNVSQFVDVIPLLQCPEKELQSTKADKLSGGQKHQLSLAMTISTNPSLVILDEPSAGLSPKGVEDMYLMLHSIRKNLNITIILIEQNIAKAMEFCNRCLLLRQGEIVKSFHSKKLDEVNSEIFINIK